MTVDTPHQRTHIDLRVKLAGFFLVPALAFPVAVIALSMILVGLADASVSARSASSPELSLAYGHISWIVSNQHFPVPIWVFVGLLAPLSWATIASVFFAWGTGDCRSMMSLTGVWILAGALIGGVTGVWTEFAYAAIAFAMIWSGRRSFETNRSQFFGPRVSGLRPEP